METACRLCFGPDRGHLIHDAIVMAMRGKKKKKS